LCSECSENQAPVRLKMTDFQGLAVRDPVWGAPLWARILLVGVALGCFGLRFADRDLVPYILDEPKFQDVAQRSVETGTWPTISPVVASLGARYGPGPVYFFTAVHHLLGPRPERSAFATTLFLTLVELALAASLARALRGGTVLFATLAVLLAGSPFLFFWSRLAWDALAGFTAAAVALAATDRPVSLPRGLLIGALLGLALASHPMTLPLSLATLIVLGWEVVRRRTGVAGLLSVVAALVLVNIPYILALRRETRQPSILGSEGFWTKLLNVPGRLIGQLLEPARVLTTSGVEYFFEAAWSDFLSWLGAARALLTAGSTVTVALAIVGATGLTWAARRGGPGIRRVARIGLLAWVGLAVLLSFLGLVVQPHYQLAAWWLVPAGVGALAMALRPAHPLRARALLACVWVLALGEVAFDQAWMQWVRERGGTAGVHYSVPMAAQRALLNAACSTDRPQVALANRTYLFPESLLSLAQTEPACTGKRVAICSGHCPPLEPKWRVVSVDYAAYPGGRLASMVNP
jgi:hypothetical protein